MSPPLPGSDVIVPHWAPFAAVAKTAVRCSVHSARVVSGRASQNPRTAGCIDATNATDESAPARPRRSSQIGLVDSGTLRQSPPSSSGTPARRKPAWASCSKSAGSRLRRACRSARWVRHSVASSPTFAITAGHEVSIAGG